jgi:predicted dehydrogenase
MKATTRRNFVKTAALAPAIHTAWPQGGPNDQINIGVIGFRGRGRDHYRAFARIPGVRVAFLCDIDERLYPEAVAEIEKIGGYKPETFVDARKMLERKDLHAVSIATPDHWHALHTIWACQAGKDVYVEKPVSHNLREGRKMIEAARKYNRIV